ncbi:MAG: efflux RND transporter periplasmic adaptor subunit [Desulfuromonadaceae bacterium]|nr:efflux RND transporter periplasmic adaptor subunit [Desulfuromonadaceae bacterium]
MIRSVTLLLFLIILLVPVNRAQSAVIQTALVQTVPLKKQVIAATITGYGLVGMDPLTTANINFPVAGQVSRLYVSQGELVTKGAPLVELLLSVSDALSYSQARSNLDFARSELVRTQYMTDQQLATSSQLQQARKNVADAEAALAAQKKLGTNVGSRLIRAKFDGIVGHVSVAPGDRLQAGTTALQLARRDRMKVTIGIEPEDMGRVRSGMQVQVSSVFNDRLIVPGRVEKVFGMINPQTRLVDVTVTLRSKPAAGLTPGTRVKGSITIQNQSGYAVPRRSVLKDAGGTYLFVVRKGLARRIAVIPGIEGGGRVAVSGRLIPGDRVVVLGNYELREGMATREQQP